MSGIQLDTIVCADALDYLRTLPDESVNLVLTDPPYNIGKADWDSWPTDAAFIAWLEGILAQYRRVLKPNGSLYLFCATALASKVELATETHLRVLANIRWRKQDGWHQKARPEDLRAPFPASESVIFAEQYAASDSFTFADYELNGKVYEPLKNWFRERALQAGITSQQFNVALGFASNGGGVASGVIGDKVQFAMPTEDVYRKMQTAFTGVFNRDYADLRKEYERLRKEYERLRRPYLLTDNHPKTDIWEYKTVAPYPGKHICEKPLDMMRDIIAISSREGDVVLDTFVGSGNSLRAAKELGRHYLGCDADPHWAGRAHRYCASPVYAQHDLFTTLEAAVSS